MLCPNSSVQGGLLCTCLWVHFSAATKNTTLGFIILLKTDSETGLIFLPFTCIHHHRGAKSCESCSLSAGAAQAVLVPAFQLSDSRMCTVFPGSPVAS